jgi:hypothetical protein
VLVHILGHDAIAPCLGYHVVWFGAHCASTRCMNRAMPELHNSDDCHPDTLQTTKAAAESRAGFPTSISNQTSHFPPTMSSPSSLHGVVAPDQLTLSRDAREASPTRRRAALPSLQGDEAPRSVRVVACEACRIAKVRCSQHRPTCRRCTKRRVECVYTGRRTPSPSPILESGEVSIERDGLGPVGRSST